MEIRVLRYFLTVVREEGIIYTATADVVKERIERWVVLMPANDPLADQTFVTAKELENLPLILPRRLNVQSELVSRPLSPEFTATTVLAWKREQPFSKATEKFIEYAKCFLGMGEA